MEGTGTFTQVLGWITELFTSFWTWFGEFFDVIVERPLLLIIVLLPILYGIGRYVIGTIHRLGLHN